MQHAARRIHECFSSFLVLLIIGAWPKPPCHAQVSASTDTVRNVRFGFLYGMAVSAGNSGYVDFFTSTMNLEVWDYDNGIFESGSDRNNGSGVLFTVEWLAVPQWGFGAAFSTLGGVIGHEPSIRASGYSAQNYASLISRHSSTGYYAIVTHEPWPRVARSKAGRIVFGAGAGISDIHGEIKISESYYYESAANGGLTYDATRFSLVGFATIDWRLTRVLLFGIGAAYRWTPTLDLIGGLLAYRGSSSGVNMITIPDHSINFSNFLIGVRLGATW